MRPSKSEIRPKARTTSVPKALPTSKSFTAKRGAPSASPARHLTASTETSPIRSYASPGKDYSHYTPLRLAKEKTSQSFSKIVYKSKTKLNASVASEDVPRLRSRASAFESLNDLRNKTERLDEESKRFAAKVSQIKEKIHSRPTPQLASRRPQREEAGLKPFARTCTRLVARACASVLREALDALHARAERVKAMERQGQRFHQRLRLKAHFQAWKAAFEVKEIEGFKMTEIAVKHYHLQLSLGCFAKWKETRDWSKLRPEDRKRRADISTVLSASARNALEHSFGRPTSVSPKPEPRPATVLGQRKPGSRSPVPSPKPSKTPPPKRTSVSPKPVAHKKTPSTPIPKPEPPETPVSEELMRVAAEHHRLSSIVMPTQFFTLWKPWKAIVQAKQERARLHRHQHLGRFVFQAWLEFYVASCEEAVEEAHSPAEDTDISQDYTDIVAVFRLVGSMQQTMGPRVLAAWKDFTTSTKSEQEQEVRRNLMWKKVNSWLGQYKSGDQPSL